MLERRGEDNEKESREENEQVARDERRLRIGTRTAGIVKDLKRGNKGEK
jgi:hypothetical protein